MNRTALVTGVAGGIGFAVASKLLSNGYTVVGMDVRDALPAPLDGDFLYICGDLSSASDRSRFVSEALNRHHTIDALINVAGVAPRVRNDILSMTEESYDFVMNINAKGTLFLTQLVANEMIREADGQKAEGKAIVNISSMSAYTSSVNRGEYCISKAAVSMITRLFADRLAEYGIPVNEIRPGIIATGMTAKVKDRYDRLIADGICPIRRWGRPEDVADAVFALMNGSLPYVTGQSLDVDGGFHIQRL